MRLSEGIGIYVQRKRADGFAFENGSKTLSRFRKQIGPRRPTKRGGSITAS